MDLLCCLSPHTVVTWAAKLGRTRWQETQGNNRSTAREKGGPCPFPSKELSPANSHRGFRGLARTTAPADAMVSAWECCWSMPESLTHTNCKIINVCPFKATKFEYVLLGNNNDWSLLLTICLSAFSSNISSLLFLSPIFLSLWAYIYYFCDSVLLGFQEGNSDKQPLLNLSSNWNSPSHLLLWMKCVLPSYTEALIPSVIVLGGLSLRDN